MENVKKFYSTWTKWNWKRKGWSWSHSPLKLSFTNIRGLRLNFVECESLCITNMHDFAVYVDEGIPFPLDLSLENCGFLLMFSTSFTWLNVLRLFPLLINFSSLCTVFDSISSNIDEVHSINPSGNVFVFGDFNVHHKDWLAFLVELIDQVNSAMIFLSQMTLLRWLTFLLDPWLWLSQSCCFRFISFIWC